MSTLIQNISIDPKERIAKLVCKYGSFASIAVLDPSYTIFEIPGIEGCIGYRLFMKCAVVFGNPICKEEEMPRLALAFRAYCRKKGWSVIYVTATEPFVTWAREHIAKSLLEVGEELYLDPSSNPKRGSKGRALRNKINNAMRENVTVHEYMGGDPLLEEKLEMTCKKWLKARKGPQIYLMQVSLFSNRVGRRWFYAKQGGKIVGVLLLQELQALSGWLMPLNMHLPEAPRGTSEQLVLSAKETLKREGTCFLTFGTAQPLELGEVAGLNPLAKKLASLIFKASRHFFHLDRRRRYLRKYRPEKVPSYLLFEHQSIYLREMLAVLKTLHVSFGSLFRK